MNNYAPELQKRYMNQILNENEKIDTYEKFDSLSVRNIIDKYIKEGYDKILFKGNKIIMLNHNEERKVIG